MADLLIQEGFGECRRQTELVAAPAALPGTARALVTKVYGMKVLTLAAPLTERALDDANQTAHRLLPWQSSACKRVLD